MVNKQNKGRLTGLLLTALFLISGLIPYGCKSGLHSGLEEGKIVYEVTFESADINPIMKALLPGEVTTYFSGGKTCTIISMGMNMMETRLISDAMSFKYTTLVSAMGKKMALVLDKNQVAQNYSDRVELKVVHTGETKEIAGIKCKQAMVTDSTNNTYPVYYTEDFDVQSPNWSSPFRDIDGMLMEYSIRFGDMVMNLKAKEIVAGKNDVSLYTVPEGYEVFTDPKDMKLTM
ncbi:MAG: hypothetical protein JNL49_03585 [Bacteroidia bacterium]|nr:hypothetical protein [Bacteroidia bacterium]